MTKDEGLRMALEALESNRRTHYYCEDTWYSCPKHEEGCANDSESDECNCGADKANAGIDKAIKACEEALAQPEPEPVAFVTGTYAGYFVVRPTDPAMVLPVNMALYTHSKEWKDLTDEEIEKMRHLIDWTADWSYGTFARAIEAKLKEKNT